MLLTRGFSLKFSAIFWSGFLAALLIAGTFAVAMLGTKAAVTFNKVKGAPAVPGAKPQVPVSPSGETAKPNPEASAPAKEQPSDPPIR